MAESCLRLETAPLTILAIKIGLLFNLAKKFNGPPFYETLWNGFEFSGTIDF